MPKSSKKSAKRSSRLEYHLTECAMHMQMAEQIVQQDTPFPNPHHINFLKHRKQAGLRIKAMYKILQDHFDNVHNQV
jgi:hypothetical protein